jgi:cysteine-rich repeat protein
VCSVCMPSFLFFLCSVILSSFSFDTANANTEIRVCDSLSPSLAAPKIYTDYIKELHNFKLYTTNLIELPSYCEDFAEFTYYDSAEYRECETIKISISKFEAGKGLTVNWPTDYLIQTLAQATSSLVLPRYTTQTLRTRYDTNENEPLHNFIAKTAQSTVWTSVTLDRPEGYTINPFKCYYGETSSSPVLSIPCIHPLYQLSQEMFKGSIRFSSTGLVGESAGSMDGYIQFAKHLYSGSQKKLVQARDADGLIHWGVLMAGCSPPEFKVKVIWEVDAKNRCNKPVITITDITESPNHRCKREFSSNWMRGQIAASLPPIEQQAKAYTILKDYHYAINTEDSLKVIKFSSSHISSISRCLFPSEEGLSYKWDEWSVSAPGKCVVCSSRGRLGTQVPRACNGSLASERDQDCCFDCVRGHNLLTYGSSQNHCVKACQNGFAYNDEATEVPRCVACAAGKYTKRGSGGKGGCWSCAALGNLNAVVDAKRGGCVSCGSRSYASGTKCIPCPALTYAPQNSNVCERCPEGSRLISAESTECTPCSAGFRYDPGGNCILCPLNTFKDVEGKGDCTQCPYGTTSLANRSTCTNCNILNLTITPYAMYAASGCDVMCNRSVAYAHTSNPYAKDGCRPCSVRPPPVGTYPTQGDCTVFLPCTNAPATAAGLAEYTSGGSVGNPISCTWACKKGYSRAGDWCMACYSSVFNVLHHVYTNGCNFACLPGLYYRGPNNQGTSCTQVCINLQRLTSEYPMIYPRLSDYYTFFLNNGSVHHLQPATRPRYIMGHCGTDEKDPTSVLPLLKYVGIYAYHTMETQTLECGNYMLNTGEECDDGNVNSGDGCDAACLIERDGFWDCDIIGEPCKPDCGWNEMQNNAFGVGLAGFKFDPRAAIGKGLPWCTGMTYHGDFGRIPTGYKAQWMHHNPRLVFCECQSNPMQTLPYSECNYTNRGCRVCDEGHYMDDLYSRCSRCGSACAIGFRPYNATVDGISNDANAEVKNRYGLATLQQCNSAVSTSTLTYADPVDNPFVFGREQIMIGCVPCTLVVSNTLDQVVFVQGSDGGTCNWACKRDPANQTDPDYYCVISNKTVCNGLCSKCEDSLNVLNRTLRTSIGKYISPCKDGDGHREGRCNSLDTVLNAQYTGSSVWVVGDRGGCPWECNIGYQRFEETCKRCMRSDSLTCGKDEMAVPCTTREEDWMKYYCAPCSTAMKGNAVLQPLEEWRSVPPLYSDCVPACQQGGAFRSNTSTDKCQQCTQQLCDIDHLYVPCTATEDSSCVPCSPPLLQSIHKEYYQGGTCMLRCVAGYTLSSGGGQCIPCSDTRCDSGLHREHACLEPNQRHALPQCVPCQIDTQLNLPTEGRLWIAYSECVTTCKQGWMLDGLMPGAKEKNRTCIPCPSEACTTGFEAQCLDGSLQCQPCPLPIYSNSNVKYAGPGNCSLVCTSSAYLMPYTGALFCTLISVFDSSQSSDTSSGGSKAKSVEYGVDLSSITAANKTAAMTGAPFPARTIPHSAYAPG